MKPPRPEDLQASSLQTGALSCICSRRAAYLAAALTTGMNDPLLPNRVFTVKDFAPEAMTTAQEDCLHFLRSLSPEALRIIPASQAGEGLWLARNNQSNNFRDNKVLYGDVKDELLGKAEKLGQSHVYIDNYGQICLTPMVSDEEVESETSTEARLS